MSGRIKNAVLPEPLATMVTAKNPEVERVEELKNLWEGGSIPQVGIFVQEKTLLSRGDEVERFIGDYIQALESISDAEIEAAIERFGVTMSTEEFRSSIKYMNLDFIREDRKSVV